jgi:hypothetical protein
VREKGHWRSPLLLKRVVLSNTATLATPGIPPHIPRFQAEMAARSANVGFTPFCGVARLRLQVVRSVMKPCLAPRRQACPMGTSFRGWRFSPQPIATEGNGFPTTPGLLRRDDPAGASYSNRRTVGGARTYLRKATRGTTPWAHTVSPGRLRCLAPGRSRILRAAAGRPITIHSSKCFEI